jgi:hypothetical protein
MLRTAYLLVISLLLLTLLVMFFFIVVIALQWGSLPLGNESKHLMIVILGTVELFLLFIVWIFFG